jgi:hypothetical protein
MSEEINLTYRKIMSFRHVTVIVKLRVCYLVSESYDVVVVLESFDNRPPKSSTTISHDRQELFFYVCFIGIMDIGTIDWKYPSF